MQLTFRQNPSPSIQQDFFGKYTSAEQNKIDGGRSTVTDAESYDVATSMDSSVKSDVDQDDIDELYKEHLKQTEA